eukprot:COSAG01_NODE_64438_length_276_cov_1.000000_1_plen_24_part_01
MACAWVLEQWLLRLPAALAVLSPH